MAEPAPLDPEHIVRVLARHDVDYVLIGALAARLYGFPRLTADIDITPRRDADNLVRLAAALRDLDARVFTDGIPEGLPFDCSGKTLAGADMWNLVTLAGRIDVAFTPSGTRGYEDLTRNAERFTVFDEALRVASLEDIIRSKAAANRPQDRLDVPVLEAILARQKRPDGRE